MIRAMKQTSTADSWLSSLLAALGAMTARVSQLWVYPIKACRGHQVEQSDFSQTCLQHDRSWCVVDLDGTKYPKLESISQRKLPKVQPDRVLTAC